MSKGTRNTGLVVIFWFAFTSAMQYSLGAGKTPWWIATLISGIACGILGLLLVHLQESANLDGQMKENEWQMKLWGKFLGKAFGPDATLEEDEAVDADQTHLPPVQA